MHLVGFIIRIWRRDWTPSCWNGNFFCHLAFTVDRCQATVSTPLLHSEGICFVGCSQVIRNFKILGAMTVRPSVKVTWMNIYCSVSWRTARTRDALTAISRNSNVHGWAQTGRNSGLTIVLPNEEMYRHCSAIMFWPEYLIFKSSPNTSC